ncbi:hypothetical protein DASC09_015080 [Saccharomycopsis crataegensis]|uniref:RRM domain-containing protein n=1 Tax=Saccharomycopsis crataegensis TaxID=43959 RepID=A0AAV5QJ64_9ASCO|nr:hypothetical protein DASC09_015080 [Saccharomycopsis crataegensis]
MSDSYSRYQKKPKGIHKPSSSSNTNSRSSDRRLAAGRAAASFLHANSDTGLSQKLSVVSPQFSYVQSQRNAPAEKAKYDPKLTVERKVGDHKWQDKSLLEWDPKHFRLFVGNLGPDANDELLYRSFGKYESLSKCKVPMDNKSGQNKGYGFVAFVSADDYFKAFKEMDGKYVGQHPVKLKRAQTEIKVVKKNNIGRGKKKGM